MRSYTSLLVIALAASTVNPVMSAEAAPLPGSIEPKIEPVGRGLKSAYTYVKNMSTKKKLLIVGGAVVAKLLIVGTFFGGGAYLLGENHHYNSSYEDTNNTTKGTPPPSTNTTSATQPTTPNLDRRTSPHLPVELLSRADLEEALSLFNRMLDRLD